MERIQGLKEYVQTEHYLEGIGIGKEEQKEIQKIDSPTSEEWFGAVDGGKQEA